MLLDNSIGDIKIPMPSEYMNWDLFQKSIENHNSTFEDLLKLLIIINTHLLIFYTMGFKL